MSEEEKKAIKYITNCLDNKYHFNNATREKDKKSYKIVLNLIKKQEKVIDEMAKFLEDELTIDTFCVKENCYADEYIDGHCQKCIDCKKKYFYRKVEAENE